MFHLGGSLVKIMTTIHKLFFKPKLRANGISFIKLHFSKKPDCPQRHSVPDEAGTVSVLHADGATS